MIQSVWAVVHSFATGWRFGRSAVSRKAFETWQRRRLAQWLRRDLPQVRAYRGQRPHSLQDLPKTDKATLMADFAAYNRSEIAAETVKAALLSTSMVGDLTVGASTGTSGNRGYFVISEVERYRWLGALLAKAIPDLVFKRQRVAVILPQNTRLYDSARASRLIDLKVFDITLGPETWQDELVAFSPTIVIAPPRLLRWCAEMELPLDPVRIFSAAETLDPLDRKVIETWAGISLSQIYMATEGLLGVSCREGGLHLAEDSVFFEFEDVGEGLVSPLVTSFRRREQIMARYRMNDLLRLAKTPCACGSPLQLVDEVVGRRDDCFEITGQDGACLLFTPDGLRNAVVKSDESVTDYRVVQTGPSHVELHVPIATADVTLERAREALADHFARRGARVEVSALRRSLALDPSRKLRRVERRIAP